MYDTSFIAYYEKHGIIVEMRQYNLATLRIPSCVSARICAINFG